MVFPLVSWFEEGEMGKKQATTNVVARCRDALHGPPTSWVPPGVLHPPFLRQPYKPLTSLRKGEGRLWLCPRL
jgi:hypothetical protein